MTQDQRSPEHAHGFGPLTMLATIAVLLTTLATAISYCRVFPDWSFLGPMVATVVLVHIALAVCRWFHLNLLIAVPIAVATLAISLGLFSFPDTLAIVIPTRATWDAAWQTVADSFATFATTVAPVPSDGGYALSATGGLALVAIVADTFAFRAFGRVESVIPAALMFAVASSLGVDRNRVMVTGIWLACAVLAVALLRAAHSETTVPWLGTGPRARTAAIVGGAGALAAGAILSGVVFGPRVPGADADAIIDTRNRGGGNTTIVSPLVSVQARLVNRSNVELFTVATDGPAPYFRLAALSDFDGKNWTDKSPYDSNLSDAFVGNAESRILRQEFTIAELGEAFVPAAFSIVNVQTNENLEFDADTATLIRRERLFSGMRYLVESAVPTYTPDQLRAATAGATERGQANLEMPGDFSEELVDQAFAIAGDQPTAYDKALALQNWFQSEFTYEVNVPRGNGQRVMESFINSREGYCEQFATTFAAFARVLGVPARVVIGFTPGDLGDDGLLHVRGKHAHAWPEVYFDDLGWVMFEPTPGRGAPGAEGWTGRPAQQAGGVVEGPPDAVSEEDRPRTTDGNTAPTSSRAPTTPTIPEFERPDRDGTTAITPSRAVTDTGNGMPRPLLALMLALAAGVVWVVAMPPIVKRVMRQRVGDNPADRATAAWSSSAAALELIDAGRREDETPLEHAGRVWHVASIDQKLLTDLANDATKATYAAETVTVETAQRCEDDAARVARLVRRRASKTRLLAARISPRVASRTP